MDLKNFRNTLDDVVMADYNYARASSSLVNRSQIPIT